MGGFSNGDRDIVFDIERDELWTFWTGCIVSGMIYGTPSDEVPKSRKLQVEATFDGESFQTAC